MCPSSIVGSDGAEQVRGRGVVRQWNPAQVIEHKYLARVEDDGDVQLCRVVKNGYNADLHTQGGSSCRLVEVVWLTKLQACASRMGGGAWECSPAN